MRSFYSLIIEATDTVHLLYATDERAFGYAYDEGGYGEESYGGRVYLAGLIKVPEIPILESGSSQLRLGLYDVGGELSRLLDRLGLHALSNKPASIQRIDFEDRAKPGFVTVFEGRTDDGISFRQDGTVEIPLVDLKFSESVKVPRKSVNTTLWPNRNAPSDGKSYPMIYGSDLEVPCPYINTVNYKYLVAGHATKAAPSAAYKDDVTSGVVAIAGGNWTTAHELDTDNTTIRSITFTADQGSGVGIYADVQGRADDGAGTITGTANALIEQPHHVAESVWRHGEELLTADLDLTQKSVLNTEFSSWKLAHALLELTDSDTAIEEIVNSTFRLLRATTLSDGSRYLYKAGESTDTIDFLFEEDFNILDLSDDFAVGLTPLDDIATEVLLKYNYNYRLGDYTKSIREQGNSSTGTDYHATLGAAFSNYDSLRTTLEVFSPWVRDDTTAGLLRDWIIRAVSIQRWTVSFYAPIIHDSLGRAVRNLKIGDIAGLTYKRFNWTQEKFQITKLSIADGGSKLYVEAEGVVA